MVESADTGVFDDGEASLTELVLERSFRTESQADRTSTSICSYINARQSGQGVAAAA